MGRTTLDAYVALDIAGAGSGATARVAITGTPRALGS